MGSCPSSTSWCVFSTLDEPLGPPALPLVVRALPLGGEASPSAAASASGERGRTSEPETCFGAGRTTPKLVGAKRLAGNASPPGGNGVLLLQRAPKLLTRARRRRRRACGRESRPRRRPPPSCPKCA